MGREASKNLNIERCESPETSFRWTPCLLNPHQAAVSESRGGASLPQKEIDYIGHNFAF